MMAPKPVTVSQLNSYIGRVLQTDPLLGSVSVKGEISNLKYHSSGHVYFSMKDERSSLRCFLSAYNLEHVRFELEEGMEITAAGNISVYEQGGYYSLYVKDIDVTGRGDLAAAFEKLKSRLAAEGLFDTKHKKEIPFFPRRIMVITAATGAAVKDILKIITSKNDCVDITVWPVAVQGAKAAGEISAAIRGTNEKYPDTDIIITGRGGGSIEDLWAFNEEAVARAIYDSGIPVISAVGHEIDVTIADFVADARAETPTAAADMAVPDTALLREDLDELRAGMLDRLIRTAETKEEKLQALSLDVFARNICTMIDYHAALISNIRDSSRSRLLNLIAGYENSITAAKSHLDDMDPRSIMKRGYSAVTGKNGRLIGSTAEIHADDELGLTMSDGSADVIVTSVRRDRR